MIEQTKTRPAETLIYEVSDTNFMLKSLIPDEVKVNIKTENIRLKSNLNSTNKKRFNKKSFLCTILMFSQSYSGPSKDIDGFIQLIAGSYKSDRHINITGIDKFQ